MHGTNQTLKNVKMNADRPTSKTGSQTISGYKNINPVVLQYKAQNLQMQGWH